tara:strand:+ start:722 stop:994 length:273 start_codon:yes stop_codon:yes gene_type:complete
MLNRPEAPMNDLDSYKKDVAIRLGELNVEEARGLATLHGSSELITISKIIGPEVSEALAEGINEIVSMVNSETTSNSMPTKPKRGLAARK